MNFLAHLFLSGHSPELLIGNLLGDYVKGSDLDRYPEPVREGIRLHRRIDSFSAEHAGCRSSRERISPERRRYAGIIVDVGYDHFLIRHWADYADQPLSAFVDWVYDQLQKYPHLFSGRLAFLRSRSVLEKLLSINRSLDGVDFTLKKISVRLKRQNSLGSAVDELRNHYAAFDNDFKQFFPELIRYVDLFKENSCATWTAQNGFALPSQAGRSFEAHRH